MESSLTLFFDLQRKLGTTSGKDRLCNSRGKVAANDGASCYQTVNLNARFFKLILRSSLKQTVLAFVG